jgi:hypothetical protein
VAPRLLRLLLPTRQMGQMGQMRLMARRRAQPGQQGCARWWAGQSAGR